MYNNTHAYTHRIPQPPPPQTLQPTTHQTNIGPTPLPFPAARARGGVGGGGAARVRAGADGVWDARDGGAQAVGGVSVGTEIKYVYMCVCVYSCLCVCIYVRIYTHIYSHPTQHQTPNQTGRLRRSACSGPRATPRSPTGRKRRHGIAWLSCISGRRRCRWRRGARSVTRSVHFFCVFIVYYVLLYYL